MDTKRTKPASPAIEDAAKDAVRQETETSGLTPDKEPIPERWPFPPRDVSPP